MAGDWLKRPAAATAATVHKRQQQAQVDWWWSAAHAAILLLQPAGQAQLLVHAPATPETVSVRISS